MSPEEASAAWTRLILLLLQEGSAARQVEAEEFLAAVRTRFPDAETTFEPDLARQAIVDSWPEACEDAAARADWGWAPTYDLDAAFDQYLVPRVRRRYGDS